VKVALHPSNAKRLYMDEKEIGEINDENTKVERIEKKESKRKKRLCCYFV